MGDIQGLVLRGNQLQGVLPGAALADLQGLVMLDLSDNEIGGWQRVGVFAAKKKRPYPPLLLLARDSLQVRFKIDGLHGLDQF